ncbi:M48 family metallopeptidase [Streptomyces hygroscopicus]|uniref:M48 family metallopeptidase n=1 Tax=Streptomyces hygroscopicus TaxID=1912 RepID=UPI0033E41488
MIAAARAVLALALLAVLYALVASMVLLWAAFLAVALWSAGAPGVQTPPTSAIIACAAFAPIVFGMAWAVVRTARPSAPREDAVTVTRRGAPELWRMVEELALGVGTHPPAHIRLTAEVNASVTEDAPLLGLAPGRRVLYLGLPLLAGLSLAELRAVLAHELGHFSHRHSRFGAVAHRGAAGLVAARQAIQDASAANDLVRLYAGGPLLLLGLYTYLFRWLTRPVRRRQELEADREAARVAGPGAVADALCSTEALGAAWQQFLAEFLAPMRRATGRIPDDPFRAFAHMVEAPELREPLATLRARAVERPAGPDDAHPPLATRLERLARLPAAETGAVPLFARPLSVPPRYAIELGRILLPGPDAGRRVPWRDWLTELAEHRARRPLAPLAEAVRTVEEAERTGRPEAERTAWRKAERAKAERPETEREPDALTIQRVLRLLDGGRRMPLARALNSRLPRGAQNESDPLRPLADALAVLIGAQLVSRGVAYWAMDWTGPSILVPPAGIAPETIHTWADTAVRLPGQTHRLGLHLAALGVDERAPLPTGPAGGAADGVVPGAPGGQSRLISIAPGATGPASRRITAVRALALTVLLGMAGLTFVLWANRDEPSYPGTPVSPWTDGHRPGGGTTGTTGGTVPAPLPTYLYPTAPVWPTPPAYRLPSPSLPGSDIKPLVPRSTP